MGSSSSKSKKAKHPTPVRREVAIINSSDRHMLRLKIERNELNAAIGKYERVKMIAHESAKQLLQQGDRRRALYCLKREKLQQQMIESVMNMLNNIETMIDNIDMANVQYDVMRSLELGNKELSKLNSVLNVEDIERMMTETCENIDQARSITALLSQPISGMSDDQLLRELEAMENKEAVDDVHDPKALLQSGDVSVPTHAIELESAHAVYARNKSVQEQTSNGNVDTETVCNLDDTKARTHVAELA